MQYRTAHSDVWDMRFVMIQSVSSFDDSDVIE